MFNTVLSKVATLLYFMRLCKVTLKIRFQGSLMRIRDIQGTLPHVITPRHDETFHFTDVVQYTTEFVLFPEKKISEIRLQRILAANA